MPIAGVKTTMITTFWTQNHEKWRFKPWNYELEHLNDEGGGFPWEEFLWAKGFVHDA